MGHLDSFIPAGVERECGGIIRDVVTQGGGKIQMLEGFKSSNEEFNLLLWACDIECSS